MTLTLDPATEQHLQQELAAGRYRDPSALIAHALELVQAER
jgi:Arc/MetJ-type ribon-helix-helix transcriptional regulator